MLDDVREDLELCAFSIDFEDINPFVAHHVHDSLERIELIAIDYLVFTADTPLVEMRALGYVLVHLAQLRAKLHGQMVRAVSIALARHESADAPR